MSLLDKFRKGAQKAGVQATAFVQTSSTKVASGSREFMQGFSLPGEAEKAANILESFLGTYTSLFCYPIVRLEYDNLTDSFADLYLSFPWRYYIPFGILYIDCISS